MGFAAGVGLGLATGVFAAVPTLGAGFLLTPLAVVFFGGIGLAAGLGLGILGSLIRDLNEEEVVDIRPNRLEPAPEDSILTQSLSEIGREYFGNQFFGPEPKQSRSGASPDIKL